MFWIGGWRSHGSDISGCGFAMRVTRFAILTYFARLGSMNSITLCNRLIQTHVHSIWGFHRIKGLLVFELDIKFLELSWKIVNIRAIMTIHT